MHISEMKNWKFHLSMLALCFIQGLSCQSIVLTPTNAYANINEALTFTCTYIGYINVAGTKWRVNNQQTPYIVRHQDNTCSGSGIFTDDKIYRVGCPSDTSFTVTILRVQQEDLYTQWRCFDLDRTSNTVKILLKVSVENVVLSGPSSSFMKEHSQQTIKCKTSPGRPQPRVSWYLYESDESVKHKITVNVSTQIINDSGDGLVTVESTLQFHPNRSINNWMLNCEAWTDDETNAVRSNRLTLDIAYPPEKPVIMGLTDGEKYSLIESEFGNLTCSSYSGNPIANLTWNCFNSKPASITIEDKTVFSTVTWSGFRGQSSCLCISHHSWSGTTQNTLVMIDVLYPPNKPTMTISNTTVSGVIGVILNKTMQVKCESNSNPRSKYSWIGLSDLSKLNQILDVKVNDTRDRMLQCIATNQMLRQNGSHEDGRNETAVTIKVLYPSIISSLEDVSIPEGSNLNVTCQVQRGNPTYENISWTRPRDSKNWNDSRLTITNVSRADDTNYTCTLQNTIIPTIGDKTLTVISRTIHLNVLYKALLLNYSVLNSSAHDSVTVVENETVGLQCEIEGNPTPTCEIYNENNLDMEHHIKYSHNYATCSINFKASCLHFGVYICKGANVINTSGYTEKTINIFVECSPRPSPSVPVMDHVFAEIDTSISLYFTALSYPKPVSVLWRKFDGKSWNNVNESNNIRIYQSNLDFGMTIIRASKVDFGKYKLVVSNAVGSYIHNFYVEHSAASSQSDIKDITGLIIGLTIVVILLATIVTVFGVIWYRKRRNHKGTDTDVNNSYQNVSGANSQQNSNDNEYEKIGLNVIYSENKVNGSSKCIEDMEENNDNPIPYERLADDRKDFNQYSQLHSMKDKQDGNKTEKNVSSGKDELSNIYINIKI